MNDKTVLIKKYNANDVHKFPIRMHEVWRYAGYAGAVDEVDEELKKVFNEIKEELKSAIKFQVCYLRLPISWEKGMPVLPFEAESKGLAGCLAGSDEIVMFAATIGLEIDRHIAKYKRFSPVKALLMHAYGAERIESLCDYFCEEIKKESLEKGKFTTARFSPGYGDLPIEKQKDFFRLLDCSKNAGISLNESLLMTPSKSVTAIFGIGCNVNEKNRHNCNTCNIEECEYKKTN